MAKIRSTRAAVTRVAPLLRPLGVGALLLACLIGGVRFVVPDLSAGPMPVPIMVGLAVVGLLLIMLSFVQAARGQARLAVLSDLVTHDPGAVLIASDEGEILHLNPTARAQLEVSEGESVVRALRDSAPAPSSTYMRLMTKVRVNGQASEDIVGRLGPVGVSVHLTEPGLYQWRIDHLGSRTEIGASEISLPMLTAGRNGTILYMNGALRRLVGDRVTRVDQLFVDPPDPNGLAHLSTATAETAVQVVERASAGGRREIYVMPTPPPQDRRGVDDLSVAALRINLNDEVFEANEQARELLALTPGESAPLSDLVEGLGRSVPTWLEEARGAVGRRLRPEVVRARRPSKDTFLHITIDRTVMDGVGVLQAVLTDATEVRTVEAQFVQAQKMRAIGELAGGVAHDFNNLLTAISGHCDLLLLRHDVGDPDYDDLQQIAQNSNRAAALVGQLLAYSRKQTLTLECLDLRQTLGGLTHLLNRLVGEKITLHLSYAPDLRPTRADRRQLEQVVMNLVVNARDAMDGAPGEIQIETLNTALSHPMVRDGATVPAGEYVMLRVTDTGTGIPQEHVGKIFEPFFTLKKTGEGTGLGLSTVYGIVKQMGGFIFVDTIEDEGSTFTIYLPVAAELPDPIGTDSPQQAETAKLPPSRGDGVILLVEDEAPVRAFASRALRLRGYTVLEAESAEEALGALEDPSLQVDMVVTDVIMPGLDGPSWVKLALKQRPDVRVIFVSGYAEESFSVDRDGIPNSVFLPKPFSLADLTATVQRHLH